MYYSILPIDETIDQDITYEEITYKNKLMLVKTINGIQTIERLYSTNPVDFLNPQLQPGVLMMC